MTRFKCFNYQCGKASKTTQEKYKIFKTKMIRWNNESVNVRDQRSLYCERDRQTHQKIFYQSRKDYEKIATDNI